jgi:hypothetical protein
VGGFSIPTPAIFAAKQSQTTFDLPTKHLAHACPGHLSPGGVRIRAGGAVSTRFHIHRAFGTKMGHIGSTSWYIGPVVRLRRANATSLLTLSALVVRRSPRRERCPTERSHTTIQYAFLQLQPSPTFVLLSKPHMCRRPHQFSSSPPALAPQPHRHLN